MLMVKGASRCRDPRGKCATRSSSVGRAKGQMGFWSEFGQGTSQPLLRQEAPGAELLRDVDDDPCCQCTNASCGNQGQTRQVAQESVCFYSQSHSQWLHGCSPNQLKLIRNDAPQAAAIAMFAHGRSGFQAPQTGHCGMGRNSVERLP